jgi:hypothetical protein
MHGVVEHELLRGFRQLVFSAGKNRRETFATAHRFPHSLFYGALEYCAK